MRSISASVMSPRLAISTCWANSYSDWFSQPMRRISSGQVDGAQETASNDAVWRGVEVDHVEAAGILLEAADGAERQAEHPGQQHPVGDAMRHQQHLLPVLGGDHPLPRRHHPRE